MYSKSVLTAASLFLGACAGDQGPAGPAGETGQTGQTGETGTDGDDCTAVDNMDGTFTITCGSGTPVVVSDGADGTAGVDGAGCTATDNGNGTYTITCGTSDPIIVGDVISGADLEEIVFTIGDATVDADGALTVTFTVADLDDRPVLDLTAGNVRFTLAKLVMGTNGDNNYWQSYINKIEDPTVGKGDGDGSTEIQATYEKATVGTLTYLGGGDYSYTFGLDLDSVTAPLAVAYEPDLTHRVAVQLSGLPVANPYLDWVPNGGVVASHQVVRAESCNNCHGKLALHGGGRVEVEYCVTCHNPGSIDANSDNNVDMKQMIHKIHMGRSLPSVEAGGHYTIWGYNDDVHDYSEVGYPQDQKNCMTCHDPAVAADADNWMANPTMEACNSCHDDTSFVDPPPPGMTLHTGGATSADNSSCATCHDDQATIAPVDRAHLTENSTSHNPGLPTPLSHIEYAIRDLTVDGSGHPTFEVRVLRDGTALDLQALPADLTNGNHPRFRFVYALPQDGIDEPADFNNLGMTAGQPDYVGLDDAIAGTGGTVAAADGDGFHSITLTGLAFPSGATMRTIAMERYFEQTANIGDGVDDFGRHAITKLATADGDTPRRMIVDNAKCANCHEWFEGHGGNRVYEIASCTTCHNPSLTSSGRAADPLSYCDGGTDDGNVCTGDGDCTDPGTCEGIPDATVAALGPDPLTYPEATNNLKDMIHGIHASHDRDTDYEFVRDRNGGIYYNWSHVTFPNASNNCETCHMEDTYDTALPAGVLATTNRITTGIAAETRGQIETARDDMPNATDLVITPVAAACYSCHDGLLDGAHMEQNGAYINAPRLMAEGAIETCDLCHGAGRTADVGIVHAGGSDAH